MKTKYIKPETCIIASLAVESLLNSASYSDIPGGPNSSVSTDDSPTNSEVDGAAKDHNAWATWDEY